MLLTKFCKDCGQTKPLDQENWYYSRGRANRICKLCQRAENRRIHLRKRAERSEKVKLKRLENIDQVRLKEREYAKLYRERNRELINARNKARYKQNPEQFKARSDKYKSNHPERVRESRKRYRDESRQRDPEGFAERRREAARKRSLKVEVRFANNVRAAIHFHLKRGGGKKSKSTILITGWSMDQLMSHLEPLFEEGMSFENYGDWHIDHIIPVGVFQFSDENDPIFQKLWALDNLAPLWSADNSQKLASLEWKLPDSYKNPRLRKMYEAPSVELLKAIAA